MQRLLSSWLLTFLVMPPVLNAQEEKGFKALFNGTDLNGWVEMGPPGGFSAESGSLILKYPKNFPAWLRTEGEFENFQLKLEYRMPGWCETGLLLFAPPWGRASRIGLKIHLRHDDTDEGARSNGSIYDVLPPKVLLASGEDRWNHLEIHSDWPELKVWLNGRLIHDVDRSRIPEMRWRLRRGYIGLQDLNCQVSFRGIQIKELASRESWTPLIDPKSMTGWETVGTARWSVKDGVIRAEGGDGYLVSEGKFSSFELQTYVRSSLHANGGVFFRWRSKDERGYEAQIYNVSDATNPTGSLYGIVPAGDSDAIDGEWFLLQIISKGHYAAVLVNGRMVVEKDALTLPEEGRVALQMHSEGWIEFRDLKIRLLRD